MDLGNLAIPGFLGRWLQRGTGPEQPGADILLKLEIDLAEAARGSSRNIEFTRHESCAGCGGSGWRQGASPPPCAGCGGRRRIITMRHFVPVAATCPKCSGKGPPITDPCPDCSGRRFTPRTICCLVNIPAGVESGMWLQLRNQGESGDSGAPRGNLRIQIMVKTNPVFERRHRDLYCRIPVSEAALAGGCEVEVPTLEGTCALRIPRGSFPGDLIPIRGLGMPDISGRGRGDLVVEIVRAREDANNRRGDAPA